MINFTIFFTKKLSLPPPPSKNKLPNLILVPNTFVLHGYVVTPLRRYEYVIVYSILPLRQAIKATRHDAGFESDYFQLDFSLSAKHTGMACEVHLTRKEPPLPE